MSVDRRKLFALGGLGALGAGTGLAGPELDWPAGITIRISWRWSAGPKPGWHVLVPDWDHDFQWNVANVATQTPPVKWMPLEEFLAALKPDQA
jgi:hypothetical protein